MQCSAAGREQNKPLWSEEAPQGAFPPVLEGPGTAGAGMGGGILGGRAARAKAWGWNLLDNAERAMGMTAASWLRHEKQALLGPSQSQTGE